MQTSHTIQLKKRESLIETMPESPNNKNKGLCYSPITAEIADLALEWLKGKGIEIGNPEDMYCSAVSKTRK